MDKLEIYVHIPFCAKKCDYCDFLSMRGDSVTKREYVSALINEIKLSKDKMEGYLVDTIFIGGGTPSILEGKYIGEIMDAIRQNCVVDENAEITIECNPGTLDKYKLKYYKDSGINRISIGLQSANDDELMAIGRIHNFDKFLESYKLAREAGFSNINVDIMSALPGQSIESYRETLKKVTDLNPEHISAYSLIVEEETPLYDRVEAAENAGYSILPDEDTEREMYYETGKFLKDSGYMRYEISNYSKVGYECRHNIGYWKRKDYLGFGLGAASLYKNTRYSNIIDLNQYISVMSGDNLEENENFWGETIYQDDIWDIQEDPLTVIQGKIQKLSNKDMMEEFMFLGLRMMEGISVDEFEEKYGRKFETVYGNVADKLISQGLLKKNDNRIMLTDRGIDVSNYAMSEFLL